MSLFIYTSLFVLMNSCTIHRHPKSCFALIYNNYEGIKAPRDLVSENNISKNTVFSEDFKWLLQTNGDTICDLAMETLLDLTVLSYWDTDENTQKKLSNHRPPEIELSVIGKIDLSNSFNSYLLLLSRNSESLMDKQLFLLNEKNNDIKSCVCISHIAIVESNCFYMFTLLDNNNRYSQKHRTIRTDVIDSTDSMDNDYLFGHVFQINKNGQIEIQ